MDSMADPISSTDWQLVSDPEVGEMRLEHVDSGRSYILDGTGGVREPEGDGVGEPTTAEEFGSSGETVVSGSETETVVETSTETCTVGCDETTGVATIHGSTSISVDAPVVDVSARTRVDVSSGGGVNITGEDRFEEDSS
jgi:hypothetical protein